MWLCRRSVTCPIQETLRCFFQVSRCIRRQHSDRSISEEVDDLLKSIPGDVTATHISRSKPPKLPFPSPRALTGARGNTSSLDNALRRSSRSSEAITIQRKKPDWLIQKEALNKKFTRVDEKTGTAIKEPWSPRKKISPEAMQGIRTLHAEHPDYDLPKLASIFKISPEAVRRILRSKWQPTPEEAAAQAERWKKRKQSVWQRWADQGRIQLPQKNMKERVQPAQRTAPLVVEKRLSVKSGFL